MKKQAKFLLAFAILVAGLFALTLTVNANDDVRVEFNPPSSWTGVSAWGWGENGDLFQGGWPGPEIEFDEDAGAYVIVVPGELLPITMFFKDHNDHGTRFPAYGTGYLEITEDVRFDLDGVRVEFIAPAGWSGVSAWGWSDNGDLFEGGWPGPEIPFDEASGAYVIVVPEALIPLTMFFKDHGNHGTRFPAYGSGEYLTIYESIRFDMSGIRLDFSHPSWNEVYVVTDLFEPVAMEWDSETETWFAMLSVSADDLPMNVTFRNAAGEETLSRPVTRDGIHIRYEQVRQPVEEPVEEPEPEVTTPEPEVVTPDPVVEDDTDNTVLFIIIAVVAVAVIVGVVVKGKKK